MLGIPVTRSGLAVPSQVLGRDHIAVLVTEDDGDLHSHVSSSLEPPSLCITDMLLFIRISAALVPGLAAPGLPLC